MTVAAESKYSTCNNVPALELVPQPWELARANVLGVGIDAVTMERALSLIATRLTNGPKGYVCAVDVHGILEALRDAGVADAFAHAAFALPDGAPTVWVGRLQGHRAIDHVTGPSVMREVFARADFAGFTHFLYGGKPSVAEDLAAGLQRQFPCASIVGTYTPPFRDLTRTEELEFIERVNAVKPDILWIGIGAPRQDIFMRRMLPYLNVRMMFGVGAAFDFLSGRVRECPGWVKRSGFHWLHRLFQEPGRLWRRNLMNTTFLWHIALQLTALRAYPIRSGAETGEKIVPSIR